MAAPVATQIQRTNLNMNAKTFRSSLSGAPNAFSIGPNASDIGPDSTAVGANTQAVGQGVALGSGAIDAGVGGVAVGYLAAASTTAVALGANSSANQADALALGASSQATFAGAVAIGKSAQATQSQSTAVGESSLATGGICTALGALAQATGVSDTAVGGQAKALLSEGVAVGVDARSSNRGIAIGAAANNMGFASSIAIGRTAVNTTANQFIAGQVPAAPINTLAFIGAGGLNPLTGTNAPGPDSTGIALIINNGAIVPRTLLIGPLDSAGLGFRAIRVIN